MIEIIAFSSVLAASGFWFVNRRLFNPGTVFLGILGLQLCVYSFLDRTNYSPLSDTSIAAIGSGLFGFLVGYSLLLLLIHNIIPLRHTKHFDIIDEQTGHRLFIIGVTLGLLACVWHAAVGIMNIGDGDTGIALLDLRMVHLTNPGRFMLAPHIAILAQYVLLYLYLKGHRTGAVIAWMVSISIFCALWKMERSAMMLALFSTMAAIEARHGRLSARTVIAVFSGVFVIFLLVAVLRDSQESSNEALTLMLDYFARNLQTFDIFVVGSPQTGDWSQLLGKYLTVFGVEAADDGLGTDGAFNTYTYLKPLYLFGGEWFPLVFGLSIGFSFGLLYNWFARRSSRGAVLYCFLSFSLFMSFFEYTFNWTNWAYYAIAAMLVPFLAGNPRARFLSLGHRSAPI